MRCSKFRLFIVLAARMVPYRAVAFVFLFLKERTPESLVRNIGVEVVQEFVS